MNDVLAGDVLLDGIATDKKKRVREDAMFLSVSPTNENIDVNPQGSVDPDDHSDEDMPKKPAIHLIQSQPSQSSSKEDCTSAPSTPPLTTRSLNEEAFTWATPSPKKPPQHTRSKSSVDLQASSSSLASPSLASSSLDSRYGRRLKSPARAPNRPHTPGLSPSPGPTPGALGTLASSMGSMGSIGLIRSTGSMPSPKQQRGEPELRRPRTPSRSPLKSHARTCRSPSKGMHGRSKSDTAALFKEFTPTKQSTQLYSDRFIPSRAGSNLEGALASADPAPSKAKVIGPDAKDESFNLTYSLLLRNELLGHPNPPSPHDVDHRTRGHSSPGALGGASTRDRTFRFRSPKKAAPAESPYSMSPVGSQKLLGSPRKLVRKIAKTPYKILDAPALLDDFYLNLVHWSSQNLLAVGLGSCVYLWAACTSKVTTLCDLGQMDQVTSVCWTSKGTHLAVGTRSGAVQVWDASKCKLVRTMTGHSLRVGTLAWNSQILASGSRDRCIYLRDARSPDPFTKQLVGHKQEVCGLKWSFDEKQLASGGNDNKLLIWDAHSTAPILKFGDHTAAVKAIAWSPHQHGLLASGGGTADRHIRFWNTQTNTALSAIDTGSQVCNLMWSKNVNEIVSTHGYSLNQIIVWKYPTMTPLATLTGHTYRVLYLAMSPDGQSIVTGAGDETLRFWNVFPSSKSTSGPHLGSSLQFPTSSDIR